MLRVFFDGAPGADRTDPWVRYAADGRAIARGRDVPARWPAEPRVEVVLAADHARLTALTLPAMPRSRLRNAARYAVEDQLATSADESAIAVAAPRDGAIVAAIASQALIGAIAADARVTRIVPEAALAPQGDGWMWCASGNGNGFVRRADGSAFATGMTSDAALPSELTAALAQAARAGNAPADVHVAFECDAARLRGWSQASGVAFVAAPAWHWERARPDAFATAPDFLARDEAAGAAPASATLARALRPALMLAGIALAFHVAALAVQWSWLSIDNWRLSRALVEQARAAGLADASTPAVAAAAIAHRNTELRHRAGQRGPADALPLLARAAPSIGALPAGALRSARYAGEAWTLELGSVEPGVLSTLTRSLAAAGVEAIAAPTSAGTRMRLALGVTAQ